MEIIMPGLLIKDMPAELHRKLKESAEKNRRSMTKQALVLIEEALTQSSRMATLEEIQPVRPNKRLTDTLIETAIQEGRP
jgi:hypothetical protein